MITRNFNLYLNAGHSVPLVINVNQYDSGEQWVFTLYNADGTQYTPSTGAIVGIKSDGLGIINSGSVDSDGRVVINETQQMTAAVGKAVFELLIDSQTHGTANFVVLVEEKPGNNADMSESDLSLLQEAIDATSPLPTGGTVGQVLTKTANGSAWSDAGTPTQAQVAEAVSDWADEHITVETGVVIDTSLSVAGAAADAKKTGDEISDLKSAIQSGGGFNAEVKAALETLLEHVAYTDEHGQDYLDALHAAMYPPTNLSYITAVYTQSETVYDTDSLNSLKSDLVVTAYYSDSTTAVVTNYVLSGTLIEGTSTITVTYGGKTATFNVIVVHENVVDYTADALTGVNWIDNYTYNLNTGELTATNGEHCTEKFTVQDCIYNFGSTNASDTWITLFMWDEEDNYCGNWGVNGNSFPYILQLKPNNKYALKLYNTSSFDSSNVSVLPSDKRSTATNEFSIQLADYVNSIGQIQTSNRFELDVTDILSQNSVTTSNLNNAFTRMSFMGIIGTGESQFVSASLFSHIDFITSLIPYQGHIYLHLTAQGITTLEAMKQYITDNNVVVGFNY